MKNLDSIPEQKAKKNLFLYFWIEKKRKRICVREREGEKKEREREVKSMRSVFFSIWFSGRKMLLSRSKRIFDTVLLFAQRRDVRMCKPCNIPLHLNSLFRVFLAHRQNFNVSVSNKELNSL